MDIFFLQLIILFSPGIIWERIDFLAGINRPANQFDVIRRSFCFGLFTHMTLILILALIDVCYAFVSPHSPWIIPLQIPLIKKDEYWLRDFPLWELFFSCLLAFPLSILWLKCTNYRYLIRILRRLKVTNRHGDEDVWDYTFNLAEPAVEYVHVRDLTNELNWSGWVAFFSETGQTRELVLRDVEVTNFSGEHQYYVPRVYLSRPSDSITIEFPYKEDGDLGARNDDQQP